MIKVWSFTRWYALFYSFWIGEHKKPKLIFCFFQRYAKEGSSLFPTLVRPIKNQLGEFFNFKF